MRSREIPIMKCISYKLYFFSLARTTTTTLDITIHVKKRRFAELDLHKISGSL